MSRLTEILEATAAARQGGFGEFARKNPRKKDPREKGKQEWKNPNRTVIDDLKDKGRQMGKKAKEYFDSGYTSKRSREERRQAKIARASDSAKQAIADRTPAARDFKKSRQEQELAAAKRLDNREMTRAEYMARRQQGRTDKLRKQEDAPEKLIPLHRNDEAKVRQLLKRLNPEDTQAFASALGEFINKQERISNKDVRESFKDSLLEANEQVQGASSKEALATLMKWAGQLANHPAKFGSLIMVATEELEFPDERQRQQFRDRIEAKYGRYIGRAANRPVQRNTKKAVKQRGREAGPNPRFKTRQQARDFAADQNQHGTKRRSVTDAGRNAEKGRRWSAATTSLRDA
jgi:hypothetical protein